VQGQASISFSDSTNIVPDQFYGFKKATKADPGGTQMALNIMGVDGYGVINSPKLERQEILKIVMSGNYVITEQRYHKLSFLDFKRSIYSWPIGIPFGPSFDKPGLNYPGHARILAPTIGYQRFLWKGAFASVHALNAFEKYMDEDDKKIGNGYTLYLNFHLGYQFKFFKNRFFFEPAIGCSYWPVRTNVPTSFKSVEKKWNNYFIQPGLNFGFNL